MPPELGPTGPAGRAGGSAGRTEALGRHEVTRMGTGYLGGMRTRGAAEGRLPAGAPAGDDNWRSGNAGYDVFLRSRGLGARAFTWDGLAVLVRGYVRPAG